jgi:hypothetical protein
MRAHLTLGVLTAGGLAGILDASLSVSERRGQDHRRNRNTESGHRDRAEDRTFHVSPSFSGSGSVYRLSNIKWPRALAGNPSIVPLWRVDQAGGVGLIDPME